MNGQELEREAYGRWDEVQVYFQCFDDLDWQGDVTASFATAKRDQRERQKAGRSTRIVTTFFDGDGEPITKREAESILAQPKSRHTKEAVAEAVAQLQAELTAAAPAISQVLDEFESAPEPERPRRSQGRTATGYYVCGFCTVAPQHHDPDGAHSLCKSDDCECNLLAHRPDAKVRAAQAKAVGASVEQCAERDPGRSWDALTAVTS